jgi:hypothetical protein
VNLPYYDLRKPDDVKIAIGDLRGFWKLWSACLLSICGLPTLSGIIVTRSYPGLLNDLRLFLEETGSTVSLIRHDKRPEIPPHPRGGFLVGQSLLQEAIGFFFTLDRIVAVYERADPLLNMHNMNLVFQSSRELWVEVVGPGFDASDLQRGDLSPHEIFSVSLSAESAISKITLVRRVDQASYEESVRSRNDKIIRKLNSCPTNDLARKIREDLGIPNDLETHLKLIGSPLCESQSYVPLPEALLRDTVERIIQSGVIGRYSELSGARFPLNFSTSLVNRGTKQVFWDIVSPSLKFEGLHSPASGT